MMGTLRFAQPTFTAFTLPIVSDMGYGCTPVLLCTGAQHILKNCGPQQKKRVIPQEDLLIQHVLENNTNQKGKRLCLQRGFFLLQ
jgi:hypothetical protein